jgi:ATP-dependent helicase HrpA
MRDSEARPAKPKISWTPRYSEDLPIHARRQEIIETIRAHPVVVLAGETGSGKTTQIPKFLLEAGLGQRGLIGCTQPRRVAALSVAQRIAEELGVTYGKEVGAKIRFTDQTQKDTAIKVMTDGILLNELQDDPLLRNYEAIVIDEAHERSLNIDFILGCLRNILKQRDDLKIIITSATIDTESFAQAFDSAPIIEVSGRTFPVDTHYRPIEDLEAEHGELSTIEATAKVVEKILQENQAGDILIFLSGERDIHELRRELENGPARSCDLLPLYGRLGNADQQRIFHPGGRRRIILSTNIAETSLTVPGIRYVVDTGLARISRYSPHSRTQRLPIEPIAQSSANQRQGRCGRVSNGICYRLYSEQDFLGRPEFTTPEIHRSNLASVILRMLAFRLGDIRTFPFIDPPSDSAIQGGYRLLAELGAVDSDPFNQNQDAYRLTKLGRRLAKLPVDPTVGRMLLHASEENVLPDVLVIASALSIQDPRERPADLAKEADEAHKGFIHKESDFLTLLNIWNTFHDQMDQLSQGQLRRFCKQHFLGYQRMREWRDIHSQLERILKNLKLLPSKQTPPKKANQNSKPDPAKRDSALDVHYAAIHRSILCGLLSNIAVKVEAHDYRGPRGRRAMLFPGSGLFDQDAAKKQRKASYAQKGKPKPAKTTAPDWIVCGEWMETSRLFARTAAKVEVEWIEALAGDLLQIRHTEPFWSTKSAAALCKERKVLFGLEISQNNVSYSRVDPEDATEIFIRNGLIEGGIREQPEFLKSNEAIREQAESELARRQLGSGYLVEDSLFDFYFARLQAVGSYAELRSFAKAHHQGRLDFLKATLQDLVPADDAPDTIEAYPQSLSLGGTTLNLYYKNEPGSENDGVTLRVPLAQVGAIQQGVLDWAIPGHLEEKIESLLRGLPKATRIALHPLKERAKELKGKLTPSERPLAETLAECLKKDYEIQTYKDEWARAEIPLHLQPRIQIENTAGDILAESRDLKTIQQTLKSKSEEVTSGDGVEAVPAWQRAAERYERENLIDCTIGELPESINLSGDAGLPLVAYPALVIDQANVSLRLIPDAARAEQSTAEAWPQLAEQISGRDFAWIRRDLKELKQLGARLLPLGAFDTIKADAGDHLRRHLFHCEPLRPLSEKRFTACLQKAEALRKGIIHELTQTLKELLEARQEVTLIIEQKKTARAISFPGMRAHLESIAPHSLLQDYEFSELPHIARYLKAMRLRAERAKDSIQRDIEKSKRIQPFEAELAELTTLAKQSKQPAATKPYRLLLEEFKVSVYAQELGTAQKASEKRLDVLSQEIKTRLRQ